MKKFFFLPALFLFTQGFGQEGSRLWEVRKGPLGEPSYLFGTAHYTDERIFHFNDSVMAALQASNVVFFEVDLSKIEDEAGGLISVSLDLVQNILSALQEVLPEYLKKYPMDTLVERYGNFTKTLFSSQQKEGFQKGNRVMFLDQFLDAYAKKKEKRIEGIETVESQYKALYNLNKEQFIFLLNRIFERESINLSPLTLEMLISAVSKNDLGEICSALDDFKQPENKVFWNYFDGIFLRRNLKMFEVLQPELDQGGRFIAVGAGHLCGRSGLIEQCLKSGYTLRPVNIMSGLDSNPIEVKDFENHLFKTKVPDDVVHIELTADYPGGSPWADLMLLPGDDANMGNVSIQERGVVRFLYQYTDKDEMDLFSGIWDEQPQVKDPEAQDEDLGSFLKEINAEEEKDDHTDKSPEELSRQFLMKAGMNMRMNKGKHEERMNNEDFYLTHKSGKKIHIQKKYDQDVILACEWPLDNGEGILTLFATGDEDLLKNENILRFFTEMEIK